MKLITNHQSMSPETIRAFSDGWRGIISYHLLIARASQFYQIGGTYV